MHQRRERPGDQQTFQAESVERADFCREQKYFGFEILNEENETSGSR